MYTWIYQREAPVSAHTHTGAETVGAWSPTGRCCVSAAELEWSSGEPVSERFVPCTLIGWNELIHSYRVFFLCVCLLLLISLAESKDICKINNTYNKEVALLRYLTHWRFKAFFFFFFNLTPNNLWFGINLSIISVRLWNNLFFILNLFAKNYKSVFCSFFFSFFTLQLFYAAQNFLYRMFKGYFLRYQLGNIIVCIDTMYCRSTDTMYVHIEILLNAAKTVETH